MPFACLQVFPILKCVFLLTSIILSYTLAWVFGHVRTKVPYIIDGAARAPESCIFAELTFLGILCYIFIIYIKYLQIQLVCDLNEELRKNKMDRVNTATLISGCVACLGLTIGTNFPTMSQYVVHHIGCGIGMGALGLNLHLYTLLSFKTSELLQYPFWLKWLRMFLSYVILLNFVLFISFRIYAESLFEGSHEDMLDWNKKDKGWIAHIISACGEYIVYFFTLLYIFTFIDEFSTIEISEPYVVSIRDVKKYEKDIEKK